MLAFYDFGGAIAVPNPDYYRTAFLADATGQANGTGYATDESRHAHTLTYNGNAAILSGKFEFDGTGDFVQITNSLMFTPGSKITMEVFGLQFDAVNTGTTQGVVSQYSGSGGTDIGWHIFEETGSLKFRWSTDGTGGTATSVTLATVTAGPVYDIAVCWDGTTVFVLVDGVVTASTSFSGVVFHSTQPLRLGAMASTGTADQFLDGRFTAFVYTKGECLYQTSGTHTVPSLPRTMDTPSLTDTLWPNVSWLVAYDETLGKIRDWGPLDLPVSLAGNVAGNATGAVSGSANTIDFDGTGDYLTIPDDPLTRIANGEDFCFDAVLKPTSFAHIDTIANKRSTGIARDAAVSIDTAGKIQFQCWNSSNATTLSIVGGTAITVSTDHHVAANLNGTAAKVFLDGSQDGSATKSGTTATTTHPRLLGRDGSNTGRDFQGQWAWMRCTKTSRYPSAFTPPTGVLPVG